MKKRQLVAIALLVSMAFVITGCSTAKKKRELAEEVSDVKGRVDTLETRVEGVESKQAEVERMSSEQAMALEEIKKRRERPVANISVKPRLNARSKDTVKQVQMCLKNAGFYTGAIDGIKGRGTSRAIKDFQKANGLKADGVVGPRTWEVLSKYTSAGSFEEGATK